ncbi:MAG: WD40 repeat domain-containing protein [Anaerolineae bacterium]|jgi:hypothetical protein|nr:WD40 repeat domain-containing protein [Anaerolineae bacterium]
MKHIIRPLMVGVALAAACILPAAAQEATPIPPEATETPVPPEATALPEGVVFVASEPCFLSPDETTVAVRRDGVYDLPSGTKRFDLPETGWDNYSPDGRYLFVSGHGLYDVQTGEILIPTDNSIHNRSVWDTFSPDGRLFVDGNIVYDLNTLEQVATLDRARFMDDSEEPIYGGLEFVNEGRWLYFKRFDTEQEVGVSIYVDVETWETILDGGDYPPGMGIRFSPDYTRYAVGGEGVFSYTAGEKLFDLPRGDVAFNEDSSAIMITTFPISSSNEPIIITYLNAASGEQINRFEVDVVAYIELSENGLLFEPTLTRIVLPVIEEVGVGENTRPLIRTWQVVDVATEEVLYELERVVEVLEFEDANTLREALRVPTDERWQIDGRYVVQGEGVFDVETDALILPLDREMLSFSRQGTYVYSLNPCTVWELP